MCSEWKIFRKSLLATVTRLTLASARKSKAQLGYEYTGRLAGKKESQVSSFSSSSQNEGGFVEPIIHAEGIYLADGLDDDEEERYLGANQTVVGLFEIDVAEN